jgi:hypothetical protein
VGQEAVVDVVSLYSRVNAGVRARATAWLDRIDVAYRLHSYFEGGAAGADVFAREPGRAASSERALRSLSAARPERLLLSREATPLGRGRIEERLLRSAGHGVYDLDDALFHDVRGWAFERLFSKGATAARAAAAADVVIVGNSYLAEWASTLNDEVRIVPTCVEPDDYRTKPATTSRTHPGSSGSAHPRGSATWRTSPPPCNASTANTARA